MVILVSACCGGSESLLSLFASLIGVTALIFVAKGDVLGQILTVIFSILYAVISFTFHYYGEMITYLCMTAPIAAMAVVSWIRNPFQKGRPEVRVNHLQKSEYILLLFLTILITVIFFFILKALNTPNLFPSTVSVATSFLASYLTFRRSRFYALAYAANDLVLIILWIAASFTDLQYIPMILCFSMFFLNDLYGFISWSRMQKRQHYHSPTILQQD